MGNMETVQAVYEAFGRGDVATILSHLADDVAWDTRTPSFGLPWYEPRRGREQVAGFFGDLAANVVLHKLEPTNFLVGGDQVAAVFDIALEVKGAPELIEDQEVHLWTFDGDGRISAFAHVCDRHAQALAYQRR